MGVEQANGTPKQVVHPIEQDVSDELDVKMKKYLRGEGANLEVLKDKAAAKAEKWLMPSEGGYLEAEGIEKTWRIKQESIAREVMAALPWTSGIETPELFLLRISLFLIPFRKFLLLFFSYCCCLIRI